MRISLVLDNAGQVVRYAEVECGRLELYLSSHDFCPLVAGRVDPANEIKVVHAFQCSKIRALQNR